MSPEVVVPGARAIATAWRPPDVYYHKAGVLYAADLQTKATRRLAATRGSVVNDDETLVVGIEPDPDAAAKVKELGLPMLVTTDLVRRVSCPAGSGPAGGRWPWSSPTSRPAPPGRFTEIVAAEATGLSTRWRKPRPRRLIKMNGC